MGDRHEGDRFPGPGSDGQEIEARVEAPMSQALREDLVAGDVGVEVVPPSVETVPTTADAVAIGRLVDEILPLLIARFRAGRMGELEVRRAEWHIRVRRPVEEPMASVADRAARGADGRRARGATATSASGGATGAAPGGTSMAAVGPGRPIDGHGSTPPSPSLVAVSPGVGYYATRDGIATGSQVRSGDVLGHVDVLGVRQEVVAPGDGIVARLLAEPGEAVEWGQDLVRLEPVTRTDVVRET